MNRRQIWRHFDYWLFGAVVLLSVFGIAMIRSAIAGNELLAGLVMRQAIYVGIGLVLMLLVASMDYHFWESLSRTIYIITVIALIGIYILGEALFGSARWFDTGVIFIQPSEIAKIALVMILANYFAKTVDDERNLVWVGKSFLLALGVIVWILLQPNLSMSIVMLVIWFSMLWISGLPAKLQALFAIGGLGAVVAAFPFLENYQQQRILDFIIKDENARHGNTYNVEQALITIGSGGWFGMGYGQGTQVQLHFLRVRHTDFIFSAIAEEFGFIGTILIIGLLVFIILRCFRVAQNAHDRFGAMLAYGVGVIMFFQTAVNIGVNLNLIPVTGLTLPFVSYGGSSLISLVLGIGLVESVAAYSKPLEF
ncbi:MAG TPA: FtsW/RodA/SpoVE family cell cycle protein [Anaerolineaceae bacterium]|jgi:rod shape determining protein RodA|nr:rod shape-determining protein RodA [Longilinea sp.]NMD31782.1 rod shape-determining protein RodA [Chloroflexota bacterium]HNZ00312.1 FtsW/RodA/SpoVE family cell cycle protein [Anaerolineaceae bacterium]HOD44638.1 FtsW/RodA/SpoVE family cell cycle protein [Anaerolineaceae bacterium]HOH19664.1 FtsW/RodA/SpoVE family cell cycle protein [Anaerolineaceae bacterium]